MLGHIPLGALVHDRGAHPAGTIVMACFGDAVVGGHAIIAVVNNGAGMPDVIGVRVPRSVPTRVVIVVIGGHPHHVTGCKDELYRGPCPSIDEYGRAVMVIVVVVVVRADHVVVGVGLHDLGRAIKVLIADYLDDGLAVAVALDFDDSHILRNALINDGLDDDGVEVALFRMI